MALQNISFCHPLMLAVTAQTLFSETMYERALAHGLTFAVGSDDERNELDLQDECADIREFRLIAILTIRSSSVCFDPLPVSLQWRLWCHCMCSVCIM